MPRYTDVLIRPTKFPCPFPDITKHSFVQLLDEPFMENVHWFCLFYPSQRDITAECIMVHGDEPGTVEIVKAIRKSCEAEGIEVVPLARLI